MKVKYKVVEGFRDRLEEAIFSSGKSLTEICREAGISRTNLWSYRFDGIMPQTMTLLRLAIVLNVSTDWLLGLKGEKA